MKREFLLSFAGHALVLAALAVFTAARRQPDNSRPQVITVQIMSAGAPVTPKPEPAARLVEPTPAPQPRPQPKPPQPQPKPQPRSGSDVVRRQGLGARVEGANALGYNYYLSQMLDCISQNWSDPFQSRSRTFKAVVGFTIERDGTLTEVKVEQGSGDRSYDAACLRAVQVTEKLPPLPPEFTAPRLKIHLEFEF